MVGSSVYEYLNKYEIPYEFIRHPLAFTARQRAKAARLRERDVAKTVMVRADGMIVIAVLRADEQVDLDRLAEQLDAHAIQLVPETEFSSYFPDCDPGAVPPLGDLYGLPVVVSPSIDAEPCITFSAGSLTELVTIPYSQFRKRVTPRVAHFTY